MRRPLDGLETFPQEEMLSNVLFFAAFGAIFAGTYFYPGDEHLKPERREKHDLLMLLHPERYTDE